MSCPAVIVSLKNGQITGRVDHNWGWVPPSDMEVAQRILKIVERVPSVMRSGELSADWDTLNISHFGTLTREKYHDLYDTLKAIHYGIPYGMFNLYDFLEKA